jgi:hypothetical protein
MFLDTLAGHIVSRSFEVVSTEGGDLAIRLDVGCVPGRAEEQPSEVLGQ